MQTDNSAAPLFSSTLHRTGPVFTICLLLDLQPVPPTTPKISTSNRVTERKEASRWRKTTTVLLGGGGGEMETMTGDG